MTYTERDLRINQERSNSFYLKAVTQAFLWGSKVSQRATFLPSAEWPAVASSEELPPWRIIIIQQLFPSTKELRPGKRSLQCFCHASVLWRRGQQWKRPEKICLQQWDYWCPSKKVIIIIIMVIIIIDTQFASGAQSGRSGRKRSPGWGGLLSRER